MRNRCTHDPLDNVSVWDIHWIEHKTHQGGEQGLCWGSFQVFDIHRVLTNPDVNVEGLGGQS